MNQNTTIQPDNLDDQMGATEVVSEKLIDALIPGYQVEFDPDEAELSGAFVEDALTEEEARESVIDQDSTASSQSSQSTVNSFKTEP